MYTCTASMEYYEDDHAGVTAREEPCGALCAADIMHAYHGNVLFDE